MDGIDGNTITIILTIVAMGLGLYYFQSKQIAAVEKRLREDMENVKSDLRSEIKAVETRLRDEIKAVETRLRDEITASENTAAKRNQGSGNAVGEGYRG